MIYHTCEGNIRPLKKDDENTPKIHKKKWRPQEPETLRANWGGPVEREDMPCAMCYVRLAQ